MTQAAPTVLAIDQGTTGTTCLVIDAKGTVLGRGYREITQHYPQPGWVEHDPVEILARSVDAAREALAAAGGGVPTAIGITNQRETVVAWEREGRGQAPHAIVWQDRRTADACATLSDHANRIAEVTGLTLDPYFSATKMAWLLRAHQWEARARRGEILLGTVDTWLVWNLTGGRVFATEPTNASRTSVYDIGERRWSDEMCTIFGVPPAALPEVRPSAGVFGLTDPSFFGQAIPIAGIAGDQQAALFGQRCWQAGQAKNTYGTGAFLLFNAGTRRPPGGKGVLTTLACDASGSPCFALEAAIFIAGAAIQWLRDGLGLLPDASQSASLASSITSTDGVYFVPALTGLGAPHWEPHARGTIVGLTRGTTRAHLVRSALEAMAYATDDVLTMMREQCGMSVDCLRVDGGASQNDWLMQFQANVLGVPVERPAMVETTALGAAGLAGLATNVWPDASSFAHAGHDTRFVPDEGRAAAGAGRQQWARAIDAALHWARHPA